MDSPLRWTGSKRWHVDQMKRLYRPRYRLVEPFCGGCSIALGLEVREALLNDANRHLIDFWWWLANDSPGEQMFIEDYAGLGYYEIRQAFNVAEDGTLAKSEMFYVLNHRGFNNLWRVNAKGEFNVPWRVGRHTVPDLNQKKYRDLMYHWRFTVGDFEKKIILWEDDFVYADPPYDDTFTGYTAAKFDWNDQVRLANWLAAHDGPVVAMNSATARIQQLYAGLGFRVDLIESKQQMHRSRGRTDQIFEMMATKNVDIRF